jgi:hypothetical protein
MAGYAARRFLVNSTDWTPITSFRTQNAFAFYNLAGQDMLIRSDPTDPETEWPLSGNAQEIALQVQFVFGDGSVIFWVKQVVPGSSYAILKMP